MPEISSHGHPEGMPHRGRGADLRRQDPFLLRCAPPESILSAQALCPTPARHGGACPREEISFAARLPG